MHIVDWIEMPTQEKRNLMLQSVTATVGPYDEQWHIIDKLMANFGIIDLFVDEIIKTMDSGKHSYSAQRIYDFLAHQNDVGSGKLNFIEDNKTARVIAEMLTAVFPSDLIGFFDEQGVAA